MNINDDNILDIIKTLAIRSNVRDKILLYDNSKPQKGEISPPNFHLNQIYFDDYTWYDILNLINCEQIYDRLSQGYPHFWMRLSESNIITEDILEKHLDLPWHWPSITRNDNISVNFILKHLELPTGPFRLAEIKAHNKKCKKEKNCNCPKREPRWDWKYLSTHKKITWHFIYKTISKLHKWTLSSNTRLSTDIVESYPNKYEHLENTKPGLYSALSEFSWNKTALLKRKRIHDYNKVANLAPLLKILSQDTLPKYLIMEFFDDCTVLKFGELFTIIN